MKKILTALISIILFTTGLFAQSEHLTFKGTPIDGSLPQFVSAMKNVGYELVYQSPDGDGAALSGKFTNQEATLIVLCTPKTHTVWKIAVDFEDQSNWYSLKSSYLNFKKSLTAKYGNPTSEYEFFGSPYNEGDGYEMTAIFAEKCYYESFFDIVSPDGTNIGTIAVSIDKHETQGRITISYEDCINTNLMKNEKDSISYDDL